MADDQKTLPSSDDRQRLMPLMTQPGNEERVQRAVGVAIVSAIDQHEYRLRSQDSKISEHDRQISDHTDSLNKLDNILATQEHLQLKADSFPELLRYEIARGLEKIGSDVADMRSVQSTSKKHAHISRSMTFD